MSGHPEIRYAFLEDTWVLFAPARGPRPHDYPRLVPTNGPETCPFEPGREAQTPEEVLALREPGTHPDQPGWRVRIVPNKYPALVPDLSPLPANPGPYQRIPGFGYHEVIVETPDHNRTPYIWTPREWQGVLWIWRERLRQLGRDSRIQYVQLFKNHGREAGASRTHPHSQLLALAQVPVAVRRRLRQMRAYHKAQGRCFLCDEVAREGQQARRLVFLSQDVAVYAPFAARMAFALRIVPRTHEADFRNLDDALLASLARTLSTVFQALHGALGDAPFNLLLHTIPLHEEASSRTYVHWYLELLPRMEGLAGFELGTGWYINPVLPETAAATLKAYLPSNAAGSSARNEDHGLRS